MVEYILTFHPYMIELELSYIDGCSMSDSPDSICLVVVFISVVSYIAKKYLVSDIYILYSLIFKYILMGDFMCKNKIPRCFSTESMDETESATVITGSCWLSPKGNNYRIYTPSPTNNT